MHVLGNEFEQILSLVPEWQVKADQVSGHGTADGTTAGTVDSAIAADLGKSIALKFALLKELGAHEIYARLVSTKGEAERADLLHLVRDCYLLVLSFKLLKSNSNIRRFFSLRYIDRDEQKSQLISLSVEIGQKLEAMLARSLETADAKGFRVLLPAYVQSSVNNCVLDYIKSESQWEKQVGQGGGDDGNDYDLIEQAPDDQRLLPDQLILSQEKVAYLNELRPHLKKLLTASAAEDLSLVVVDCLFGLGLSKHSTVGKELTMRECCQILKIAGETQARQIARCQVLSDKGMTRIREMLMNQLPGVVDLWQKEVNINIASRRELDQMLALTEGEVERLIPSRQYVRLEELVIRRVVKAERLPQIKQRGAVAAFVPIDVNQSTAREMVDVLGISKQTAQKVVELRPLSALEELLERGLIEQAAYEEIKKRGAVVRAACLPDLNRARRRDLIARGVASDRAAQVVAGAPYTSWTELDEFLGNDEPTWAILRKCFRLSHDPP